jgi:hypothetical protein
LRAKRSNPAARRQVRKKTLSLPRPLLLLWFLRAPRALDCFVAIGERSDAVLSNGYASQ